MGVRGVRVVRGKEAHRGGHSPLGKVTLSIRSTGNLGSAPDGRAGSRDRQNAVPKKDPGREALTSHDA